METTSKRTKLHTYLNFYYFEHEELHPIEKSFRKLLYKITQEFDRGNIDYIVARLYQSLYRHNDISNLYLQYYQTILNFIQQVRDSTELRGIFEDYFKKYELDKKDIHYIMKLITDLKLEKYENTEEETNIEIKYLNIIHPPDQ